MATLKSLRPQINDIFTCIFLKNKMKTNKTNKQKTQNKLGTLMQISMELVSQGSTWQHGSIGPGNAMTLKGDRQSPDLMWTCHMTWPDQLILFDETWNKNYIRVLKWHRQLKPFLVEETDPFVEETDLFILHRCLGNARSEVVRDVEQTKYCAPNVFFYFQGPTEQSHIHNSGCTMSRLQRYLWKQALWYVNRNI